MSNNATISTSINELASIAIAEAQLTRQNISDLSTLLTFRAVAPGQISARFPVYGSQDASQLTEGDVISSTEVTTTGTTLTPTTNATWGTVVTDVGSHAAPQIFADIGRIGMSAIIKKKNADIFALFDGFTTNTVGSGGSDISEATILAAITKLENQNAMRPYYLVITPEVKMDLLTLYSANTNIAALSQRDDTMTGEMPEIYGVRPIVVTSGISQVGDIKCGMFTREALGFAEEWDFKIEIQRENMTVGWAVAVTASYAVGEINDKQGVEVLVDGAD